jgi:hypothetical protein
MEYLDARLAGAKIKFPLPLRRFRRLKIACKNSALHFDSNVWPRKNQKAKTERNRNHGETIGARDPAIGARSPKIGLIAGRIRSR